MMKPTELIPASRRLLRVTMLVTPRLSPAEIRMRVLVFFNALIAVVVLLVVLTAQGAYGQDKDPFRLESVSFAVTDGHVPYTLNAHSGFESYDATSTEPMFTIEVPPDDCYWSQLVTIESPDGEWVVVNMTVEQPCQRNVAGPDQAGTAGPTGCPDLPPGHSHNSLGGFQHGHVALGNLNLGNADQSGRIPSNNYIPHSHTVVWDSDAQVCNTHFTVREE